jgi:RNA polymerase sigma-70 factor (ECF subfamily)
LPFEQAKTERDVSSLPSREDEQALVERAKRDPNAFGELYNRYLMQIYRFVYSRVRDQTVAEDVTSEVFMKALKSIGRYQDTGKPFSAWLYQIAVNSVADRYRAARPVEDIDEQRDLAISGPALEEVAAQRDELRRIWSVVETLPKQQRVAMVLKFQEDMKIEDIAVAMGKSAGAVKLLIHRGVTKCRQTLGPADDES